LFSSNFFSQNSIAQLLKNHTHAEYFSSKLKIKVFSFYILMSFF